MKDLILDLQGNGGGYLNAAIDLAKRVPGTKRTDCLHRRTFCTTQ